MKNRQFAGKWAKRMLCAVCGMALTLAAPLYSMVPGLERLGAALPDSEVHAISSGEEFFTMDHDGVALRFVDNGADITRVNTGGRFSLQVWIKGIDPVSMTIPISWDPTMIEVVDPITGERVSSGFKTSRDISVDTGFQAGIKCYAPEYDPVTMQPLNWNGQPIYSKNAEQNGGGYPYLNNEKGHYRFLYYTETPVAPEEAQMILEIFFQANQKAGDPGFRIATSNTGHSDEDYDMASEEGMMVGFKPDLDHPDDMSNIQVYTDQVEWPDLTISDGSELDGSGGSYISGTGDAEEDKEVVVAEGEEAVLKDAAHPNCFPYSTGSAVTAAYPQSADGKVPKNSSAVARFTGVKKGSGNTVFVQMPDRIVEGSSYSVKLSGTSMATLTGSGIEKVYVETPYGYAGIDLEEYYKSTAKGADLTLITNGGSNWMGMTLAVNGVYRKGFKTQAMEVVVPYQGIGSNDLMVRSKYVFGGEPYLDTELPLTATHYDSASGTVSFLTAAGGAFTVSPRGEGETFSDMNQASWAEEAVSQLSALGIVHGTGGGTYSPGAAVTREQFSKMLVSSLAMYQTNLTMPFTDVTKDSAFYPYVASAYQTGTVKGVSETLFGAKEEISRQDIAVMAYRGLQYSGVTLTKTREVTPFTDEAQISDYAKEAVNAMYAAGLLNGVGNGSFDPKGTATRAAAAQITNGIYEKVRDLTL